MSKRAKCDTNESNYNLSRKADSYLVNRLIDHLEPTENGAYLDIGCGNYTIALKRKELNVFGIDPSIKMLSSATENDKKKSLEARFF